jgi:hypothetical protein
MYFARLQSHSASLNSHFTDTIIFLAYFARPLSLAEYYHKNALFKKHQLITSFSLRAILGALEERAGRVGNG